MKGSIYLSIFIMIFFVLFGCRQEADRFDNDRIEPDPEMDLGADSIGDPHFVGQDGVREYDYNLEQDLDIDRFLDPPENEYADYQFLIIDKNNDQQLSREEFYLTTYFLADRNGDDVINDYELDEAYENMFYPYVDQEEFLTLGQEENEELQFTEWRDALSVFGIFDTFDNDGDTLVSVEEWKRQLFELWDYDNDGVLTKDEAAIYSDYYNKK